MNYCETCGMILFIFDLDFISRERCAVQSWKQVCHLPFPLSGVCLEDYGATTGGDHKVASIAAPALTSRWRSNPPSSILMVVVHPLSCHTTTLTLDDGSGASESERVSVAK